MLAVALSGGSVQVVDPDTGVLVWDVPAIMFSGMATAAMAPNGAFVASVIPSDTRTPSTPTQMWHMRDTQTGTVVNEITAPEGTVGLRTLQFSPCKRWIAVAGDDHRVFVWDFPIGDEVRILETPSSYVFSLSFSGDGTLLAAATHNGVTSVWDTATWGIVKTWNGGANVCFSPTNCNLLATTSNDEIYLWDIETHTVVWDLLGVGTFAVFSHDGRTIATVVDDSAPVDDADAADEARDFLVLSADTGATVWLLAGHREDVTCASFSVKPQPQTP
jgi:WD40 repeat protein